MSLRGVRQLKELVVRYSDLDGSSRGVREWMRTNIVELATTNPDLTIKTELKRAVHPFLRGIYKNGNTKTICIKNIPPEEVHQYALHLRNQIGRKVPFYQLCVFVISIPNHPILLILFCSDVIVVCANSPFALLSRNINKTTDIKQWIQASNSQRSTLATR